MLQLKKLGIDDLVGLVAVVLQLKRLRVDDLVGSGRASDMVFSC